MSRIQTSLGPRRGIAVTMIGLLGWSVADAAEISGHDSGVVRFLLAFSAILLAAKVGGEIFERIRQPPVLGELLFGIVLGNLGVLGLDFAETLQTAPFLSTAAEIGVILLLFEVGLSSSLDELLSVGSSALTVAVLGVVAPIGFGYAASSIVLSAETQWYVHLFVGATLAATSVGITARVLKDMGRTDGRESRIILGAAIVDDVLGLIVLAFVLGLLRSADAGSTVGIEALPAVLILGKAVAFMVGSILVGRWVVLPAISLVQRARSKSMPIVLSIAYCFAMAALAELVGLADIVGAFVAGLVIADAIRRHFGAATDRYRIDGMTAPISAIFVPVFFVYMGMRVDLRSFADGGVLAFAALLSIVALASKLVCAGGVLEKGINRWAVGIGMIPRGEVGLIFAGIGSAMVVGGTPVLGAELFSSIVAMVMATTLATPPLLKAAFARSDRSQRA